MTTIAYNHKDKEIAVDSRTSRNSTIMSDKKNKIITVDGVSYIGCGDVDDIEELVGVLAGKLDVDSVKTNTAEVIWFNKGEVFRIAFNDGEGVWSQASRINDAIGSGSDWAMAAMDFGRSAKDAVKYAMTRDMYTGGKIRVIKVK